jgi:3-phosphoshikimate 1-carboxyvinyltransferase
MGADVRTRNGRPPLVIAGNRKLRGCTHQLDVPSAQVKSAILLAGLQADGRTTVNEPQPSRDHTERMLGAFGVRVARDGAAVSIDGPAKLAAARIDVPGDFSSAAFFIVAGLIAGAGPVLIRGVGVNPTRTGLLDILRLMGADIRLQAAASRSGEPVADIEVRPGKLRGINVPHELVAGAIDEFPVLFAAAALAEGETLVTGAAELRVKESDRIAGMAEGLAALGVAADARPDGMRIRGGPVQGGVVESRGDHRVAMSFAVLAARASAPVVIRDVQNVATSFPGFAATARRTGLDLTEEDCK